MNPNRLATLFIITGLLAACDSSPQRALGTLEWDQVHGRAVVSQPIVEIMVKEGESVEQGQAILRLDTRLQEAQVAQLEAKHPGLRVALTGNLLLTDALEIRLTLAIPSACRIE